MHSNSFNNGPVRIETDAFAIATTSGLFVEAYSRNQASPATTAVASFGSGQDITVDLNDPFIVFDEDLFPWTLLTLAPGLGLVNNQLPALLPHMDPGPSGTASVPAPGALMLVLWGLAAVSLSRLWARGVPVRPYAGGHGIQAPRP